MVSGLLPYRRTACAFVVCICVGLLLGSLLVTRISDPHARAQQRRDNVVDVLEGLTHSVDSLEGRVARLAEHLESPAPAAPVVQNNPSVFLMRSSPAMTSYPRVCCHILTDPGLLDKAAYVRDTWGRRCDHVLYMSSVTNTSFPTIGLGNDTAGRNRLIAKARKSWIYMYDHYKDKCDYFMKADPDTYILMENLKDYLSAFKPVDIQHFGHVYQPVNAKWNYLAGGPGEVLSRSSLMSLVEKAFRANDNKTRNCRINNGGEDTSIGNCLWKVGSKAVDTRDNLGRQRFIVFATKDLISGNIPQWYINLHNGSIPVGTYCCSDYPIGFHYISKEAMVELEYYMYIAKRKFDLGILHHLPKQRRHVNKGY